MVLSFIANSQVDCCRNITLQIKNCKGLTKLSNMLVNSEILVEFCGIKNKLSKFNHQKILQNAQ